MNPWTEKYRPKKFYEIVGQDEVLTKIKYIIENLKNKKPIILHGAPGTGKTTIAGVIANETDSEIFELNASDLRNKTKLQEILKPAVEQKSLIKQNKIILIDEVDGIMGTDRGGVPELMSIIHQIKYPVIMTANDVWGKKLSDLRRKSELIQIKELDYKTIRTLLFEILKKENLFLNPNLITSISIKAKGDLRAAINDLQSVSRMKDPSKITLDERNKEKDIFNALKNVFKGKTKNSTLNAFDSVDMELDEIMLWLEENIPKEYSGEELAKAIKCLSNADLFKGRIYKQQYWRFLVYESIFLSYGISAAKKQIKTGFTSYKKPTRILKIWMNNQKTFKKKSIAIKYAKYVHIGTKRAMQDFSLIKEIIKSNPKIQSELKIEEGELAYLMR